MENQKTAELVEALGKLSIMAAAQADAAGEIANARRRLFLAYVAEGFTEAQALELCKSLAF